jgi:predicted nuclease of predicted toxin-antitoxin system
MDELIARNYLSPEYIYEFGSIIVPHQVETELIHYQCRSYLRQRVTLTPAGDSQLYNEAIQFGFDEADAAILSNARTDDSVIVTEDRQLIEFASIYRLPAIQLIDLFRINTHRRIMSKKQLAQLNRLLREMRNTTEKKSLEIKKWLQDLQ